MADTGPRASRNAHILGTTSSQQLTSTTPSIDQLLKPWESDIRRAAFARGVSRDATEDLIQAAGIRLAEALTRCSTLPDNYLRRVIRNAMNDEFRAGRIIDDPERRVDCDGEPMDSDEIEVTDESPVASEIFLDHGPVRQWKATLSPREQIVAEVLWVQDATEREAAMMLGISKTRVHQLKLDLMRRAQSDLLALVA